MPVSHPSTAGAPYLRIERLRKQFGAFAALNDISLEIFPREFVCFLGPSGCGKTTLLSILGLLDSPASGKYLLDSEPVENLIELQRARIELGELGVRNVEFRGGRLSLSPVR